MEVDKATRETGEMEMGEKGFPERPDTLKLNIQIHVLTPETFNIIINTDQGFNNVRLGLGELQSRFESGCQWAFGQGQG